MIDMVVIPFLNSAYHELTGKFIFYIPLNRKQEYLPGYIRLFKYYKTDECMYDFYLVAY